MSATNPKGPNADGRRNKGIAKARKFRKHTEAEARNAETPFERTRAHRRSMGGN